LSGGRDDEDVENRLNRPKVVRMIALVFLGLVVLGVVATLARALHSSGQAQRAPARDGGVRAAAVV
jgi:hypothetical protein